MAEQFYEGEEKDKLITENEILKLKLMLERGATFGTNKDLPIPPEIENEFLKHIMEFENQLDKSGRIKVGNVLKLGDQFRHPDRIPDHQIEEAWQTLKSYMNLKDIELVVSSPNVTPRELYKFVIDELVMEEIDEVKPEGCVACFFYDEFHPDPVFESEKALRDCFFACLFEPQPMANFMFSLRPVDIMINGKWYDHCDDAIVVLNRFKSFYQKLELKELVFDLFEVEKNNKVTVPGHYKASAVVAGDHEEISLSGKFMAELDKHPVGYWFISKIQVEGISL